MTIETQAVLDASIRFDNLPAKGRRLSVAATDKQLFEIAERLKVSRVSRFEAKLQALPIKGGVQVNGRVEAEVEQSCVVSFVPVTQEIDEVVDRIFLSGNGVDETAQAGAEVFVDLEGEDFPDYFQGSELDFSDLLLELVALAIDPYPRAPGVELPKEAIDETPEEMSPFAALARLKPSGD